MSLKLEDYGVIGDTHTAALIGLFDPLRTFKLRHIPMDGTMRDGLGSE